MQLPSPFAKRAILAFTMAGSALVVGGACGGGDSTGPNNPKPVAISVGDTIAGSVSQTDTQHVYSVHPANGTYVVFLQTISGNVVLTVNYPGSQTVVGTALSLPNRPLLDNATQVFFAQGDLEIRVTWNHSGASSFRFVVVPVSPTPENHAATLAIGDTVNDETLATMADVDEFTFPGKSGQPVVMMIQALGAAGTGKIEVDFMDPAHGIRLGLAQSSGGDSTLELQTTGVIGLPGDGNYKATIHSLPGTYGTDPHYAGPYRFAIMAIDSAPEHTTPVVSAWDTVQAAISPIGDVDVYTFSGTAGQEFNLFLQARSGLGSDLIHATIPALATTYSVGTDTSLLRQPTGRFALPNSGQFKILVYGEDNQFGGDRGPYRFSLYPINRHPENRPDTIAFGDSVLNEQIDFPGDIDEFHVVVPDSSGVTVLVEPGAQSNGGTFTASLLDSTGHMVDAAASDFPGTFVHYEGFVTPGKYTLRAEGTTSPTGEHLFQGSYRVWLLPFKVGPELTPDTIAVGDTIQGENLFPLGDIDHYVFHANKGDHLSLELQGTAPTGPGGFTAFLTDSTSLFLNVSSPQAGDSLGGYQSNRIDFDHSAWYQVTINGGSPPPRSSPESFRFALTRRGTAPEVAGNTLTLGDSVSAEAIDYFGDWDQYTLTASPGQKLVVVGQFFGGSVNYPTLRVFDSSTDATAAQMLLQPIETVTDTFSIPASGQLQIAVFEPRPYGSYYCGDAICGNAFGVTGGYRFVTLPFSPAPENVSAAFVLGDTVRGEALSPAGDIDEFTSSATPGDTLAPWFRLTAPTTPPGSYINLEVIDPGTGTVLAGQGWSPLGPTPGFLSPGTFVVPASGNYKIRVAAYNGGTPSAATGPYEFFLQHSP